MKIPSCVVGGALVLSGLYPARVVWAQNDKPAAPTGGPLAQGGATGKRMFQLRLRNIKPSLMAFWLDPQNHELPSEIGPAPAFGAKAPVRTPKKNAFVLPEGVDRIVAIDPQDALLVFGTPEGVAKLQETIAFLDKPLRQIEIEAQFVSVKTEDVAAFGIDLATARGNFNANTAGGQLGAASKPGIQVGFVRGNFQAALSTLQKAGRIKVISAPRVTAINNLAAQISQTTTVPVFLVTKDEHGQFTPLSGGIDLNQNQMPFFVGITYEVSVTPTINNDNDSVTVRLRIDRQLQLQGNGPKSTTLQTPNGLDTIANVRDGETIALSGFDSNALETQRKMSVPQIGDIPLMSSPSKVPDLNQIPTVGKLFRSKTEAPDQLLVFVTARIVRRAGELDKNQ